ncbi:MAG: OmpA family protein [Bacteroidetes bacterium]|nr:OmpA family protein [Bacteroidota bacterium]
MKAWLLIFLIYYTSLGQAYAVELLLRGRIVEANTRAGIVATISLKKNGIKKTLTQCSSTGLFSIQLPADSAFLIIENKEYRTIQMPVYGQGGSYYIEIELYPVDKQIVDRPYFQSEQQDLVLDNTSSPASGKVARRHFVLNDLRNRKPMVGQICLYYTKSGRKECFSTNLSSRKSIVEFREDDIVGLVASAPGYQTYHGNLIISTAGSATETYTIELDKAPAFIAFSSDVPLDEAQVKFMSTTLQPLPYTVSSPGNGFAAVIPGSEYTITYQVGNQVRKIPLAVASGLYLIRIQNTPAATQLPSPPNVQEYEFAKDRLIIFSQSNYNLPPAAYSVLDSLAGWLRIHTDYSAQVLGHTDNTGDPRRNLTLSEYRARVVVRYLINHGVKESQLYWQGYGGEQPIASNESEESKAQNRRVEIKIQPAALSGQPK